MFGVFYFGEQYFSDSFPFDFAPPPITPVTTTYQRLVVSCGYRSCSNEDEFGYNLQDGSVTLLDAPAICQTRTCTVLPDVDIYNIQTGNIALASNVVLSCATKTCPDSGVTDVEIYNLQDALFFNGTPLTVIIQCPPGYICPDGSTPYTFTYPPGTFYFPKPPPGGLGGSCPYELRVEGCLGPISRMIPCGASQDFVDKAAEEIINQLANDSARCQQGNVWKLALTFNDDVPSWVCAGSEFNAIISARTYAFTVYNPSLWPVEDYSFPNDDQPIWMSAGFLPPARNLGPDSKYYGVRLALFGTVPLTTGTFEFSVTAIAPGPQKTSNGVTDPGAEGTKRYVIEIIGITTGSPLPDAVTEQEYTQYFAASGFGAVPNWGLAYGSLPDWITFNTNQGVIYGTPPIEEDGEVYTFAIFAQQDDRQCVKEFELSVGVGGGCPDWSLLSWSTTIIDGAGAKTGNNLAASIDTSATTVAPSDYSYIQMTTAPIARNPESVNCCFEITQSVSLFSLLPWNIIMYDQDGNAYVLATAFLNPVGVYTFNIPATVTSFQIQTNIDARCLPAPDGTLAAGTNILKANLYQCP